MWQIGTSITEKVWKLTSLMCVQVKIYTYIYIIDAHYTKVHGQLRVVRKLFVGGYVDDMKPAYTGHIYIH